jgi:hypothetical protein
MGIQMIDNEVALLYENIGIHLDDPIVGLNPTR